MTVSAQQIIFYIVAGIAVIGALGVVFSRDIVHSALFLVLALLMTAGVFILLSAEFLGIVQILVYGGAVTILIIFALMLTQARQLRQRLNGAQQPFGLIAGFLLAGFLIYMIVRSAWPGSTEQITVVPFDRFSNELFGMYNVPFEVVSLVLLVALIGAIVIARSED